HPYMQRTNSLDFCFILEGEITLVLDTAQVPLHAGDAVILRGTSHAWSNRSDKPCIIMMSQHDATLILPGKDAPIDAKARDATIQANVRPLRRVVTGHDTQGRSCVIYDSAVPNYFPRVTGTCFYELWTFEDMPIGLAGNADAGSAGRPFLH